MRQTACARRSLAGMIGGGTVGGSPMFGMRRRDFVALLGGAAVRGRSRRVHSSRRGHSDRLSRPRDDSEFQAGSERS